GTNTPGARSPICRQLAPSSTGTQPDIHIAADRRGNGDRVGSERHDLAPPAATGLLEDPGIRSSSAMARIASGEHDRVGFRLCDRGCPRDLRTSPGESMAKADHRVLSSFFAGCCAGAPRHGTSGPARTDSGRHPWVCGGTRIITHCSEGMSRRGKLLTRCCVFAHLYLKSRDDPKGICLHCGTILDLCLPICLP